MSDITSANAVLTITCLTVFPAPILLQGFGTEDAWKVDEYEIARAFKGVDGRKSAGFVPANKEMEITFQADSPSIKVFQQILGVMKATQGIVTFDGNLVIPAIGEVWEFSNGNLGPNAPGPPSGKKTLEQLVWHIVWDDIQPAGI